LLSFSRFLGFLTGGNFDRLRVFLLLLCSYLTLDFRLFLNLFDRLDQRLQWLQWLLSEQGSILERLSWRYGYLGRLLASHLYL